MASHKISTPDEIVQSYKDEFKNNILDARVEKHVSGLKKNEFFHIWIRIERSAYKDVIKQYRSILAVIKIVQQIFNRIPLSILTKHIQKILDSCHIF